MSWTTFLSGVFVFLWSSSFIGARYGLPHAEPLTFVAGRLALAAAILLPAAFILRTPWPLTWKDRGHVAATGILMNVFGLGGMFSAMSTGLPLALVALIGAFQPLLTGLLAGVLLGERVTARQWAGLILGLCGVLMVLGEKLHNGGVTSYGLAAAGVGLFGFTSGTLYQKAFCSRMNLRGGTAIQLIVSAPVVAACAALWETGRVDYWVPEFIFALLWLVLVVSIGAMMLLWLLVRYGTASKVASLFYMTPPVTAIMAFLLFGERLGILAVAGMGMAALGVALVTAHRA